MKVEPEELKLAMETIHRALSGYVEECIRSDEDSVRELEKAWINLRYALVVGHVYTGTPPGKTIH